MVTINRQTSLDSGNRQDYRIIQGLPMNLCNIYRNGPKRAGLITTSDRTVRAIAGLKKKRKKKVVTDGIMSLRMKPYMSHFYYINTA